MQNLRAALLTVSLALILPAWADTKTKAKTPAEAPKIEWLEDYAKAIRSSQETGKLLLIYNGWEKPGICPPCDCAKKGLAALDEDADLGPLVIQNFVCVKVYCHSVQEEEAPRGPAGPFQFQYRSVPALLVKDAQGKTLEDQFGMPGDHSGVMQILQRLVKSSLKKNGPVTAPKIFEALRKDLTAGRKSMDRKEPGEAGRAYGRLLKQLKPFEAATEGGESEPPTLVVETREWVAAYEKAAADALTEAKALEDAGDLPVARAKYGRVAQSFQAVQETAKAAKEALSRLNKPAKP